LGRLGVFNIGVLNVAEKHELLAVFAAHVRKFHVTLRRRLDRVNRRSPHLYDMIQNSSNPAVTVDAGKAAVLVNRLCHGAGIAHHVFGKQMRRQVRLGGILRAVYAPEVTWKFDRCLFSSRVNVA
jgi:hypothetical protein